MKKIFKSRAFLVLLTATICISGAVFAEIKFQANEVGYKGTTVDKALDTLYEKANAKETICMKLSGTSLEVGSKYHCNLGENELRNFYVLKVDNNTNEVELIMERNITDTVGSSATMTWSDANTFFDEGHPGYQTKQTWLTKVNEVKLPDAQAIADAGGITGWDVATATSVNWSYFGVNSQSDTSKRTNYSWLYNYIRGCEANGCSYEYSENDTNHAYGYWTKNMIMNDEINAWIVNRNGGLDYDNSTNNIRRGVRPVIVVSKSSLAG